MLRRLFAGAPAPQEARDTTWGAWQGDVQPAWSGARVTRDSALQLLAVYGCTRLIADSIATLPVDVFREKADGSREEINAPLWLTNPTVDLDYAAWCTQVLTSLLLDGNAYIAVTLNPQTGRILELIPLDPAVVQVNRDTKGRLSYVVMGKPYGGVLLHVRGAMLPGSDVGMSPVECARQTLGLGLSAVESGSRFFGQGQQMSGVIEYPDAMTPERVSDIARQWARKHSGSKNAYMPGVLDRGATWKPTTVTNEQAQFLETRGFTAAEIAGQMFLVDPSELGIPVNGTSLTYANLLERSTRRVQVTFLPWITRLEKALSSLLARPQYVKINVDGLLRGSPSQRWETYEIASRINTAAAAVGMKPVLVTDEMRELEDLGPAPDVAVPVAVATESATPNMGERALWPAPITFQLPTSIDIPTPVVNVEVAAPPAPIVNVEAARAPVVNIAAPPTPIVNVTVEPVPVPPPPPQTQTRSRRVERDDKGRILRVIDEE